MALVAAATLPAAAQTPATPVAKRAFRPRTRRRHAGGSSEGSKPLYDLLGVFFSARGRTIA